MKVKIFLTCLAFSVLLTVSDMVRAQEPPAAEGAPPTGQGNSRRPRGDGDRSVPLLGKIASLQAGTMQITNPNGDNVTVKITDKTTYRRGRETAKASDFKVGDPVMVRGEENEDHTWTARVIAAPPANGAGGGRGVAGEIGKDYVVGEIKTIDAPKLTILRTDKVTQTIELTEETSLRRGQDSVTMADMQPGDHVFVRGGMQNNVFVPKFLVMIEPEQWKRMQEMGLIGPPRSGGGSRYAQAPHVPEQNP
jgi:hypothetical protein